MSSIINALFGHNKDKDDKKHATSETTTTTVGTSSGSAIAHTAISDDVRVQSVVSTETNTNVSMQNSKKITDLMSKLGKWPFARGSDREICFLRSKVQLIVKSMTIRRSVQLKSARQCLMPSIKSLQKRLHSSRNS
jgi:hypothetical protein